MTFTPLILAGGKSTRMHAPKHLLPMPDRRPLYQHQIDLLALACPDAPTIYISLAQDSPLDDYLRTLPTITATTTTDHPSPIETQTQPPNLNPTQENTTTKKKIIIIPDLAPNPTPTSAGPAAGLLAAHHVLPDATFLVVACDHPFLTVSVLQRLCRSYQPPVTCFRNAAGFCEPLVAVWGPPALGRLREMVEDSEGSRAGRGVGPSRVVREVGGRVVDVDGDGGGGGVDGGAEVLRGVNTREEWEGVRRVLETKQGTGRAGGG